MAKARLDSDGTAKPLTRLIGHVREGGRVGPGVTVADAIEDVETGERTPLGDYGVPGVGKTALLAAEKMNTKRLWLHVTVQDGIEIKSFASLKTGHEVRDYFGNHVGELPYRFPKEFSTIWVKYRSEDGSRDEVYQWGTEDCLINSDATSEGGRGYLVEVDGAEVFSNMVDDEDEEGDDE